MMMIDIDDVITLLYETDNEVAAELVSTMEGDYRACLRMHQRLEAYLTDLMRTTPHKWLKDEIWEVLTNE